jgi:hypothetical protein
MDLQQKVLVFSKEYVFTVKSTISEYLNIGCLTQNTNLPNPSIMFTVSHDDGLPKTCHSIYKGAVIYMRESTWMAIIWNSIPRDAQQQWISWNLMLCSWIKITQQQSLDRPLHDSLFSTRLSNDKTLRHYTRVQYSTSTIQYCTSTI